MRRTIPAALALAGLLGAAQPATAAGPVFRDGFERRTANASYERIPLNQQIGPWTVTGGDVDLANSALWQVAEGSQNIDLDGGRPGTIATSLPVAPGTTYRISFRLGGNPDDPLPTNQPVKTGELRANGKVLQRFAFDTTGRSDQNMGYAAETAYLVSTATAVRVEFASTMPLAAAGWGPVLDDVRVDSCAAVACPKGAAATRV